VVLLRYRRRVATVVIAYGLPTASAAGKPEQAAVGRRWDDTV